METALAPLFGFSLVLMRTMGLVSTAPALGSRLVPVRVRAALGLVVALAAFLGAGMPAVEPPVGFLGLAYSVGTETAVGVLAGMSSRLVLEAALAVGQTAGLSMGFGFGALLDPTSGTEATALGQFLSMCALCVAVGLGIHREAIVWLASSLQSLPPGSGMGVTGLLAHAASQAVGAIALAVRLTFPLLAAVTFGHFTFGLISRAASQLNLSSIGFSVAILAGGAALFLVAPSIAHICAQAAINAFPPR